VDDKLIGKLQMYSENYAMIFVILIQ
jgi:hypothetical protein